MPDAACVLSIVDASMHFESVNKVHSLTEGKPDLEDALEYITACSPVAVCVHDVKVPDMNV